MTLEQEGQADEKKIRFRVGLPGGIARSTDGGATWETIRVFRESPEWWAYMQDVVPSPAFAQDATVYVLSGDALYRSTDGGTTWQRLQDERFGERDSDTYFALAASSGPGGTHDLFLGSNNGDFLVVHPHKAAWEKTTALVPPTPTATPTLRPDSEQTPTPVATSLPAATPTPCTLAATAPFASAYAQVAEQLGCPLADAGELFLARQPFEQGEMIWQEDLRLIYVLYNCHSIDFRRRLWYTFTLWEYIKVLRRKGLLSSSEGG